jgi:leucyl/phenylalanyl-tRNA---protein transferase
LLLDDHGHQGQRQVAAGVRPRHYLLDRVFLDRFIVAPQPVGANRWGFPPPSKFPADDLLGVGCDLEPSTLIAAYRRGIFPMIVETPEPLLGWWSPDPRGILPLENFRATKSLRQSAKRFALRVDTCFERVIRACANPARPKGWITEDFVRAYVRLHELGWAHSVEVFDRAGELAGGLYGVRIDRLFAGESMFFQQRDASKVALLGLVELMRDTRMQLLDIQWLTDHLATLGAIEVPRRHYFALLAEAVDTRSADTTR